MKLILRTAINLNVQYCWSFPVSQEDLALGTEIYLAIQICVSPTGGGSKAIFFNPTDQTSSATVIAATIREVGKDLQLFPGT